MSEIRDLSHHGISMNDQAEWQSTKEAYKHLPPFPEALRDETKPVLVLNLLADYTHTYDRPRLRTLIGKLDGIFRSGLWTQEMRDRQRTFDETFRNEAHFDGADFVFERTRVAHLPSTFYEFTKEPTEWEWGRSRVQDTPAIDVIEAFQLNKEELGDTEMVIIPPPQEDLSTYIEATQEVTGKLAHIAFYTTIRFADSVSWDVTEYRKGMPNLMELEIGAD